MTSVWKIIREGKVIGCAEGRGRGNVKQSGQSTFHSVSDAEASKAGPAWASGSRRSWRKNGSQIIINLGRIIGPLVFTLREVESLECKDRRVT